MNNQINSDEIQNMEEVLPEELNKNVSPSATIHTLFETNSDKIRIIIKATREESTIAAANKSLMLISGRLYFVPVDKNVNSDEYGNMKQFSETSDKFEIKYVKNGFACIDPVQHNIQIKNKQQLCVLW